MNKFYVIDPNEPMQETSKIIVGANSPYCVEMNKAFEKRFGRPVMNVEQEQDIVIEEVAAKEEAATEPCAVKAYRKNKVAIIFTMLAALLTIVVAVISYLNIAALADYMVYYAGSGLSVMVSDLLGGEMELMPMLINILMLAAVVFAVLTIIIGIVALAVKKKLVYFIVPLLGLILSIASVVVFLISSMADIAIVDILNPLSGVGAGIAAYATIVLSLVATIAALFSYKKI